MKIDFVEADEADRPDGHLDSSLPTEKYDYAVYDTGLTVSRRRSARCHGARDAPGYAWPSFPRKRLG